MAFSTQHFRNSLACLELRGSDTPLYRTAALWSGPAVLQRHHTYLRTILDGLRRTVIAGTLTLMPPSLIPTWGASVSAASQTQGDPSTIDGLGAIHDEREGEYEGYCCHEILLTRLQESSDTTVLSEIQEMTEYKRWGFMPLFKANVA